MRLRFLEGTLFRVVSGQDAAFASCDLGIFDELRRFLDGSGVHCAFVSGYQTVQAPQNTLDFVCPARYLSALYPPGSEERRSVEGASFCTSSGDTASRPYGPPALRWGALNAGQAWLPGSRRMKGLELMINAFIS